VADFVRREVGNAALLLENWDGEAPFLQLIADVLAREAELIGDNPERILRYTGCQQIM
jgi:hypothetical protein